MKPRSTLSTIGTPAAAFSTCLRSELGAGTAQLAVCSRSMPGTVARSARRCWGFRPLQVVSLGHNGSLTCVHSFLRLALAEHMIHGECLILPVQFDGLRPGLQNIPCTKANRTWVGCALTSGGSAKRRWQGSPVAHRSPSRWVRSGGIEQGPTAGAGLGYAEYREQSKHAEVRYGFSSSHLYAVATVLGGLFVPRWLGQAHQRDGRPGDAGHGGAALAHVVALL